VWIKEFGDKWSSSNIRNLRRGIVDYIEMCKLDQDDKGFDQEKFVEIKTNEVPNLTYHGMNLQIIEDILFRSTYSLGRSGTCSVT
jgi:hypothetical protein